MDIGVKIVDQRAPSLKQDVLRIIVKQLVRDVLKGNGLGEISLV